MFICLFEQSISLSPSTFKEYLFCRYELPSLNLSTVHVLIVRHRRGNRAKTSFAQILPVLSVYYIKRRKREKKIPMM